MVDLAHPRIEGDERLGGARRAPLRDQARECARAERGEVGDRHRREPRAVRESLRDADRDPDAGEGAGSAAEGDRVERPQWQARLGEQLVDHRQDALGVAATEEFLAAEQLAVEPQRRAAGLGRGVEREQLHGVPVGASAPRCWRRNATASASLSVTVIGGRLARKARP